MVAAETLSPTVLSTGMLSPVSADSLTALSPSVTTAVNGYAFAGTHNEYIALSTTSLAGTVFLRAVSYYVCGLRGEAYKTLSDASVVLPLERASSSFPTVMSVSIIAADSK